MPPKPTQRILSQSPSPVVPSSPRPLAPSKTEFVNQQGIRFQRVDEQKVAIRVPYGLPCFEEIIRFLVSLINPAEPTNSEELRMLGMNLINIALERGGSAMGKLPGVMALMKDDLCKYLLQNTKTENLSLLSLTLRVIFNLFQSVKPLIKLQTEVFFSQIFLKLMDQRWVTYEGQEVVLESLVDFCREKTMMPDLYANYDCDLQRTNLFENICKFLSKNAVPVSGQPTAIHMLCLDGMLAVVRNICDRCLPSGAMAPSLPPTLSSAGTGSSANLLAQPSLGSRQKTVGLRLPEFPAISVAEVVRTSPTDGIDPEVVEQAEKLRSQKQVKKRLMIGADHFNKDPKKGIEFLQTLKVLPDPLEPLAVAQFLRNTPGLNKNLIGDYLGEHNPFNIAVLHSLVSTFDFKGEALDAALRMFLESFRLPGEAQKIDRIVQAYAEHYFVQNSPCVFSSADTAYTLAFSTIMLNTDHHNKGIKKKMTLEEFIKNNRGIDNNKDIPRDILEGLYYSITTNEIKMTDDATGGTGGAEGGVSQVRWADLIKRSSQAGPFLASPVSAPGLHKDMFSIIWAPTIQAISAVFEASEEDQTVQLQKALDGFANVAVIAAHFHLGDVLDNLVVSLCKFSNLLQPATENILLNFGRSYKSQMSCLCLFSIARSYGDYLCEGWRNMLEIVLRLHKLGLLPPPMLELADFIDPEPRRLQPTPGFQRSSTASSGFWQYLSLNSDAAHDEPTPQEKEAESSTRECISSCHVDEVFTESKFLHADSLTYLAKALIHASTRTTKPSASSTSSSSSTATSPITAPVDEDVAVLCLELLIELTLRNRDRVALLWPFVHEHLESILSSNAFGPMLVQRAVIGILRVCVRMLHKQEVSDALLKSLALLTKLEPQVADSLADRIAIGVLQIEQANAAYIRSASAWQTVFSILKSHARHPLASAYGIETLGFFMRDCAFLSIANIQPCVETAMAYAESPVGGHTRSMHALDLLHTLHHKLVAWKDGHLFRAHNNDEEVWCEFWLLVLKAFRQLCKDPRGDVRDYSVFLLQRSLLSADVKELPPIAWLMCFNEVLFPLFSDLLQPYDLKTGPKPPGMEKTLQRALALLSKIFLQHLVHLSTLPDFHLLWLQVLRFMERYMAVGGNDSLAEAVPEVLKNIVLVMMSNSMMRAPPCNVQQQRLWDVTWPAVDPWYPSLKVELFPSTVPSSEVPPSQPRTPVSSTTPA